MNNVDPKRIEIKKLKEIKTTAGSGNAVTAYPDIIIHQRGNNNDNLLVIEVKKNSNRSQKINDKEKILAYCEQLKYQIGLFLVLNTEDATNDKYEWFYKGEWHSLDKRSPY